MKFSVLIILFLFINHPVIAAGAHFWFGKTMITSKAEDRWGKDPFILERFKNGSTKDRAKMAASIIRGKKAWIGRPLSEIREQLGPHDGFYFTDIIPAYLIEVAEKKGDESWQIVFLPDNARMISDVIIHKNCCN